MPENAAIGAPLLVAFARDRDSGAAGTVRYFLSPSNAAATAVSSAASETGFFAIDAAAGLLSLTASLDYESSQRHTLVITAFDDGELRLQTNMTVYLEVQDVNDNTPVFEQTDYSIVVSESLPSHSQVCILPACAVFFFEIFISRFTIYECSFRERFPRNFTSASAETSLRTRFTAREIE